MSDSLSTLAVQLELQSATFSAEIAKVNAQLGSLNKSANSMASGFGKLGDAMGKAFAAGAVLAGLTSIARAMKSAVDEMDNLGKAAQKVGTSVEALSALKYAADLSGVSFDSLQTSMGKLSSTIAEISPTATGAAGALRQIGISAGDDVEQALGKIADRWKNMPDGVQKTSEAIAIFGKAGKDMIPLLNQGSEGLADMKKEAGELGQIISTKASKQAEEFNDNISRLDKSFSAMARGIALTVLPALNSIVVQMLEIGKAINKIEVSQFLSVSSSIAQTETNIDRLRKSIETMQRQLSGELPKGVMQFDFSLKNSIAASQKLLDDQEAQLKRLQAQMPNAGTGNKDVNKPLVNPPPLTGLGGGAATKSPWESWLEGIKKAQEESDLLGPKMVHLNKVLGELEAAGQKGSATWRIYAEEQKKVLEAATAGSVGAQLSLQIEKVKEETDRAAESMTILAQKYAEFIAAGDIERAGIVAKMMDEFRIKTKEAATEMEKLGEGITDAIASNANNAVNKFIDSIGTAKVSFGDFAVSVLKDLAKVIVRLLVMKPLVEAMGGFFGGFGKGGAQSFPVNLNAHGNSFLGGTGLPHGIYSSPTLFKFATGGAFGGRIGVLGEAGSEAILPLKRNKSGDLGVQAAATNVIVNVNNNSGSEVSVAESTNSDGTKQIDIYIEKKMKDMVNGGGLDRAMRGSYGLTRIGA